MAGFRSRPGRNKALATTALVALVLFLAPAVAVATVDGDVISDELRAALKAPVLQKMQELSEIKDEQGIPKFQGSFFDKFVKEGDGYALTFFTREAKPDELVTRRYRLQLEESGDAWKIASETEEETVDGLLFRTIPGDETFYQFDSMTFEKEGMTVKTGKGSMFVDYWRGKPFRLWLAADGMNYDYKPPVELGWYQTVLKIQMEKFPRDLVFTPEGAYFSGDGESVEAFLASNFSGLRESTIDNIDKDLRKDYDEFVKDLRKARKDFPLAGFQKISDPERRTWRLSVEREGSKEHWASLSYDNYRRNEVEFTVTKLGVDEFGGYPLFVYNSEETRASGIDPYEIEQRPDLNSLDFDLIGLTGDVEMAIKGPEMMTCDFTYELEAKRDLKTILFFVSQPRRRPGETDAPKRPTLNVYTMEDGEGHDLTYVRLSANAGYIVLPEELPAGERMKLRVKFDNDKSIYKYNHDYLGINRGGWAPLVQFTDNIDYLDLTIHVEDRYQILGIDDKISETTKNGIRTAQYKSDYPLTFPTIIFGNYKSAESGIQAEKANGDKIPVIVHVDKTSMMSGKRVSAGDTTRREDMIFEAQSQGNAGIRDIREDALKPIADQAVNAINLYREIYGVDYPFKKMDLVNDPLGYLYGQAPPSIVYLGYAVFYPKARINNQSAGDSTDFLNTVVAHEIGHQWWGSAVVNKNFGNYWFVETLAEYSSALYSENLARVGVKNPAKANEKAREAYLDSVAQWIRTINNNKNMFTSVQHSDSMFPGGDAGTRTAAIYNKGPMAFHMLRETFGDDKFFPFLKQLAQELEGKEIVTRDIQRLAERSLCGIGADGQPCSYDLEWFFDQWIRGVGMPEYAFNYTTQRAEDGTYVVRGTVKQRVVLGADKEVIPGAKFRGKTFITVLGKDRKEYKVPVVINNEQESFAFKVPVEPLEIVLNKNNEMLAEEVLVNRDF